MSRHSRFNAPVDDPSAAHTDNDHRIKMYKELRRVAPPAPGPGADHSRPRPGGDSPAATGPPPPLGQNTKAAVGG
jgi:hypothetical protein